MKCQFTAGIEAGKNSPVLISTIGTYNYDCEAGLVREHMYYIIRAWKLKEKSSHVCLWHLWQASFMVKYKNIDQNEWLHSIWANHCIKIIDKTVVGKKDPSKSIYPVVVSVS